jgi:hypothetical protein
MFFDSRQEEKVPDQMEGSITSTHSPLNFLLNQIFDLLPPSPNI